MSKNSPPTQVRSRLRLLVGRLCLWTCLLLGATVLVRQLWFELYQIPTGSMRPTFREQDHLIVSKTAFGLNWPLRTQHLYFDPSLLQRGDVVVWSGDDIDLPEANSRNIGPFSFPRRYIKRLLAKGGDTVYFYGGKLYGMDAYGKDINQELHRPFKEQGLEYLPFSSFEGRLDAEAMEGSSVVSQIYLRHMNQPIARLTLGRFGQVQGQINDGRTWVEDDAAIAGRPHDSLRSYSDFWGMGNFAMARLLTKEQVKDLTGTEPESIGDAITYLELRHHPNLSNPSPQFLSGKNGKMRLQLTPQASLIPLQPEHLQRLMRSMYTSRFVVQDGRAALYSSQGSQLNSSSPLFNKVPDGTYEIIDGTAYSVDWSGRLSTLPNYHPLYRTTPTNIQRLFNLGIEVDNDYAPRRPGQTTLPSRYAYFRNGDLYVMGKKLLSKEEALLQKFTARETALARKATPQAPYAPFLDSGPPLHADGSLNKRWVHTFGLKVPEGHYLVLGDNHARSADSRYFGFVPEANLRGSPSFLLWPSGERWGKLGASPSSVFSLPSLFVWALVILTLISIFFIRRRRKLQHSTK